MVRKFECQTSGVLSLKLTNLYLNIAIKTEIKHNPETMPYKKIINVNGGMLVL